MSDAYKKSGVDVEAGYDAVKLIKERCESTFDKNVLSTLGSYGAFYSMPKSYDEPVLISGTDGVGTKLRLAINLDKHDTIGQDCVAMCVNDIICHGAKPMFFLDYLAVGKLLPERAAEIVKGIADACIQADCALIGGETAEMPGFYAEDEYDLAGFAVGVVNRPDVIDSSKVREGDIIIGIESSGVHSNGFSLVRSIFPPTKDMMGKYTNELGKTLGEALLEPTKIYVKPVLKCIEDAQVHALGHITGGGFYENLPRIMPNGLCAKIDTTSWPEQILFDLIALHGNIEKDEMFSVFNMGIGMAVVVSKESADKAMESLKASGENAYIIGEVVAGNKKVELTR